MKSIKIPNKIHSASFILILTYCLFVSIALNQQAIAQASDFVKKDLLTFTDRYMLLSAEYPSDWSAEEFAGTAYFSEPLEDNTVLTINIEKDLPYPTSSALNDFVNDQLNVLKNDISSYPQYSIGTPINDEVGGEKAYTVYYRHTSTLEDFYFLGFRTYVVHNGNGYIIELSSTTDSLQDKSKTNALADTAGSIIDSIRLLDPSDFPPESNYQDNDASTSVPAGPCSGSWWWKPECGYSGLTPDEP